MSTLRHTKAELRKIIQNKLRGLGDDHTLSQSHKAQERLFSMPEYMLAKHISVYLSMPSGEVMTQAIVEDALRKGKKVFVPYLDKEHIDGGITASLMDMVSLNSEADYHSLKVDKWGIPTPEAASIPFRTRSLGRSSEAGDISRLDMIVVPGIAFDQERRRLGHGKGFYDMFLHRYREELDSGLRLGHFLEGSRMPFLVGLALHEQVLPEGQAIPTSSTDWALDALIIGDGSCYQQADHMTLSG